MIHDFTFSDLLKKRDFDLSITKLIRHDQRGGHAWLAGRDEFDRFVSIQKAKPNPYLNAKYLCQFVPLKLANGAQGAMFVGTHEILSQNHRSDDPLLDFELRRLQEFEDLIGRVVIQWGESPSSARSWYQWPHRQAKPIVELRSQEAEQPFPGYNELILQSDDLSALPPTWRSALSLVKGIYLLVAPDGKQYVGSAYGDSGILGRWLGYDDGDNGNQGLKNLPDKTYSMSILQVASSTMTTSEIIACESKWKDKLGSRVHGHNRN